MMISLLQHIWKKKYTLMILIPQATHLINFIVLPLFCGKLDQFFLKYFVFVKMSFSFLFEQDHIY